MDDCLKITRKEQVDFVLALSLVLVLLGLWGQGQTWAYPVAAVVLFLGLMLFFCARKVGLYHLADAAIGIVI